MKNIIPPASAIKARLADMSHAEVQQLSRDTGVPFTTLWKIRDGTTLNPGIETVRLFWPELLDRKGAPSDANQAREVVNG